MFIDTQVVSNVKKGRLVESIRGARISSVAVSELLLVYTGSRTSANYYVPVAYPLHMGASIASLKQDHPYSKRSTDQILFSFGSDFAPLIEFGSSAIAKIVNDRNVPLLQQSISFLDKETRKLIREDFEFLVGNDVRCEPLRPSTVEAGYRLLKAFQLSGEKFRSTFRNTWNDLLILAAALDHGSALLSKDSQLNRFAASSYGECGERIRGFLQIRFHAAPIGTEKRTGRESKNYMNKGWRATFKAGIKQAW
jgi:hypothetical protein